MHAASKANCTYQSCLSLAVILKTKLGNQSDIPKGTKPNLKAELAQYQQQAYKFC